MRMVGEAVDNFACTQHTPANNWVSLSQTYRRVACALCAIMLALAAFVYGYNSASLCRSVSVGHAEAWIPARDPAAKLPCSVSHSCNSQACAPDAGRHWPSRPDEIVRDTVGSMSVLNCTIMAGSRKDEPKPAAPRQEAQLHRTLFGVVAPPLSNVHRTSVGVAFIGMRAPAGAREGPGRPQVDLRTRGPGRIGQRVPQTMVPACAIAFARADEGVDAEPAHDRPTESTPLVTPMQWLPQPALQTDAI